MISLIHMYIIFYTLNLFIFYLIIFLTTPLILLWRTPINVYLIFLKKYNKFYNLILLLLFNLTGLPPTVFFFIKVNLLFDLVYRLNFFNILFLFFVFFSSAIYYLQPLYNKNSDYDLTSYLNKYIFCSKNVAFTNYFFYKTS